MATVRPYQGTPFEQALERLEAERNASPPSDTPTRDGSPSAPPVASRGRLVHVPVRVRLSIDEAAWLERHGGSVDDLADAVRRYVPEALRESSAARAGLIVSARRDRLYAPTLSTNARFRLGARAGRDIGCSIAGWPRRILSLLLSRALVSVCA